MVVIKNKDFGIKRLDQVKDVFLFSCYTGMSYSDLSKDFEVQKEGEDYWIIENRQKTDEGFMVYLTQDALRILRKYDDRLPVLTNQRMNSYLKEIADVCGIKKRLTFHMARHTCAVYLLNKGVPLEVVSRILGHSSIKTTQVYAKILKGTIKDYMKNL